MSEFVWKGTTRAGSRQEGVIVADGKGSAVQALRRQGIHITSVREKGKEVSIPKLSGGVGKKELAIFTRQLSVMIDAGLPLTQCLELLGTGQQNRAFQRVLHDVRRDLETGSGLAESMARHPRVFDPLYTNMIAAGEAGGILDVILQRLAVHIEKAVKLRRAVRTALIYPVAVISIASLVLIVILWKVIPTFEQLFVAMQAELPLPTRVTIALSRFVGRSLIWFVPSLFLTFLGLRSYHGTYRGRRVLDGALLKVPVVGLLLRKIAVARFCRTLGTLVASGVPILDAMDITARTSGNAIIEDAILLARRGIEEGKTVAEPLRETEVFPEMVTQMIAVGEQTGALDAMLSKIADFYEEEVDAAIENLMSLLEPVMILFLGVTIGGIVISMYLPMFNIIRLI